MRRVAAVLPRAGSVRHEDLERNGSGRRHHDRVEDRRLGGSGATTIWMDGRPHPSKNAPHERGGFTTGEWEGTTLVAYTTHIKAGSIRRNGAPSSDQATMTTHFIRHGDLLTVLDNHRGPGLPDRAGDRLEELPARRTLDVAGRSAVRRRVRRRRGTARCRTICPEKNPSIDELTKLYGIPREATLGGAETMYPEIRKKIKDAVRPAGEVHAELRRTAARTSHISGKSGPLACSYARLLRVHRWRMPPPINPTPRSSRVAGSGVGSGVTSA